MKNSELTEIQVLILSLMRDFPSLCDCTENYLLRQTKLKREQLQNELKELKDKKLARWSGLYFWRATDKGLKLLAGGIK